MPARADLLVHTERYDAILLDLGLPDLDQVPLGRDRDAVRAAPVRPGERPSLRPRHGRLDREPVGLADLVRALLGGDDDVVPAIVDGAECGELRAAEQATALIKQLQTELAAVQKTLPPAKEAALSATFAAGMKELADAQRWSAATSPKNCRYPSRCSLCRCSRTVTVETTPSVPSAPTHRSIASPEGK